MVFPQVSSNDISGSELVLLTGPSGSGKSALVKTLMEWIRTERQSLTVSFGTGKFDQMVNNEPFAAIVSASNDLCDQISHRGTDCIDKFNAAFGSLTGGVEEARMLNNAIPGLRQLTGDDQSEKQHHGSLNQAFARFKQLWRYFLKAAKCLADVTVLFLDDIHWADANSLDLINSLVTTIGPSRAKKLLLVCAYRNDDTSLANSQKKTLRWCLGLDKLQEQEDQSEISGGYTYVNPGLMNTSIIDLSNLNEADTNAVVCGLLFGSSTRLDETLPLSKVIHSHTGGNPFFVRHYLDYLTVKGLISTVDEGVSWDWEIDGIRNQDDVPQSVSDLLLKILSAIPEKMLNLLVTAAHIGHKFSSVLLEHEWLSGTDDLVGHEQSLGLIRSTSSKARMQRRGSNALIRERSRATLAAAVDEGLLERHDKFVYRFPHDQIQKSLYSMMSDRPQEQAHLHNKIGKTILLLVEQSGLEESAGNSSIPMGHQHEFGERDMFTAVDNLNLGSSFIVDPKERLNLASLNYDASQLALRKSASVGATKYARRGIELLGEDRWESNYDLCLDLYSLAARLEHCSGNFVRTNLLISEIHRHGKTVLDRVPAYFTEIDVLGSRGELAEAQKLGIMVLRQLGESMSKGPTVFHVLYELFRASRYMNKAKEKGFLNLPPMRDPSKVAAMSVLASISLFSFLLGPKNKKFFAVSCLRMARLSCRDGLSIHSPSGINGFAAIQTVLGRYKEAFDNSKIGLDLLDHIDGASALSARNYVAVFGIMAPMAGQPLEDFHHQFLRSYHVGMASGDVDDAYYGIVNHVCCCYYLGTTTLDDLHDEFDKYLTEMEECQVNLAKWLITAIWFSVRRLLGKGLEANPGDSFAAGRLVAEMKSQERPEMVPMVDRAYDIFTRLTLGTLGGSTLAEDERAVAFVGANDDALQVHYSRVFYFYSFGVCSYELLRQTGKRKHRRNARRALKELRAWYNDGVTVAVAPFLLLSAEAVDDSSRNRDPSSVQVVKRAYLDAATAASGVSRCLLIEAYCYERLAKISLQERDGGFQRTYEEKVFELYTRWGASAKVEQLRGPPALPFAVS